MIQKALRTAQNYLPGGRDSREAISRHVRRLRGRPHDPDFAALRYFPPRQVLLDVGGNYGQSIQSMRLMQPDAEIVSYEPNAELASKVARLFATDSRVTVRPYGLSDEAGTFDLYLPYYRKFAYPGLASVISENTARVLLSSATLYLFRPQAVHVKRIRCQLDTLDNQGLAPYFIKIDVQGAEHKVLRGGQLTLSRHQPILLVETAGDARISSLLEALGYSEYAFIKDRFIARRSEGWNSFFITQLRRSELMASNRNLFAA